MNKAGIEGQNRLMGAVALWLRGQIESHLPPGQRGMNAPALDQGLIAERVESTLRDLARDLALKVQGEVGPPRERVVTPGLTKRLSVMDNLAPCTNCQEVRSVAILNYQDGKCVSVDCERCAPEFRRG